MRWPKFIHSYLVSSIHSTSGSKYHRGTYIVAVLAFKAVYTLEVKRRENDRRILALYTEYVVQLLLRVYLTSPMSG